MLFSDRDQRLRRHRHRLSDIACLAGLFVLAACGDAGQTPVEPIIPKPDLCAATPGVGVRATAGAVVLSWAVLPQSTDACITLRLDSLYAMRAPSIASGGKLFVFLPGTDAIAQNYQLIVNQAARAGYHAIGLSYPNQNQVSGLCAGMAATCSGDTRREILTGASLSSVVTVDRANSIENRLIKLLRFMAVSDPGGNWGQFVSSDSAIAWDRISIAGHSQGGGHALFIAQQYSVARATAYSSPGDLLSGTGSAAPWMTQPFATPTSRLFGLTSTADELVPAATVLSIWATLGMSGAAVNIDVNAPPYTASQRFVTSITPINPGIVVGPNHNVVAVDVNTPRVTGTLDPVLAPVWRALSFP